MNKKINKMLLLVFCGVLIFNISTTQKVAAGTNYQDMEIPEYIRQGYLVAHAMGALDGKRSYSNSLEAFMQNYKAGHRIFETDFQLTSDNILISLHDRDTPIRTFQQENNAVPYTLMSIEDICRLMLEYDDFYIITDTKELDNETNRIVFDIIAETVKAIDPSLINRIAIQFYNQEMYYFLVKNYNFPHNNYLYTLYKSFDTNRQIVEFIKKESIRAVVMWDLKANDRDFVTTIKNEGVFVYAHTFNDVDEVEKLFSNGVYGIYTDTLIYDDLPYTRTGRYSIFTQNLSPWAEAQVSRAKTVGLVPQSLQANYKKFINRAEFCSLCVALYEKIAGSKISEYATYKDTIDNNVQKMGALGVVNGTGDGNFTPDGLLTREQAAVIICRMAQALGKPFHTQAPTFNDREKISTWAWDQVGQVQAVGIIGGVGNNTFAPKELCNREQSILMIIRLFDRVS